VAAAITVSIAAWLYFGGTLRPGKSAELHKASSPAEKVTLAYVASIHSVLTGIAQQRGYYLQEGLDVTPRLHSFGKSALGDLIAGNADFATAPDIPIMMAIMKGEKISVIATIQTSSNDNAIVTRKDTGILKPADLKGKTIAATATS
jgi:NitT/TauT family transport system substrate-binding protein